MTSQTPAVALLAERVLAILELALQLRQALGHDAHAVDVQARAVTHAQTVTCGGLTRTVGHHRGALSWRVAFVQARLLVEPEVGGDIAGTLHGGPCARGVDGPAEVLGGRVAGHVLGWADPLDLHGQLSAHVGAPEPCLEDAVMNLVAVDWDRHHESLVEGDHCLDRVHQHRVRVDKDAVQVQVDLGAVGLEFIGSSSTNQGNK